MRKIQIAFLLLTILAFADVVNDVINRTNSVVIVHLEEPGRRTAELLSQFLNRAVETKKAFEQ